MSKSSERVKKWRKNFKERIVEAFNGGCCICGYNKCNSALALHHLDPNEKDLHMGKIRANPRSWNKIVLELKKCVLVCHNCHSEIHANVTFVPADAPKFNEKFSDYERIKKTSEQTPCLVCGILKPSNLITCSILCSRRRNRKIDWDSINLEEEIKIKPIVKIAEELNCSDGAVHKRLKKLGLK